LEEFWRALIYPPVKKKKKLVCLFVFCLFVCLSVFFALFVLVVFVNSFISKMNQLCSVPADASTNAPTIAPGNVPANVSTNTLVNVQANVPTNIPTIAPGNVPANAPSTSSTPVQPINSPSYHLFVPISLQSSMKIPLQQHNQYPPTNLMPVFNPHLFPIFLDQNILNNKENVSPPPNAPRKKNCNKKKSSPIPGSTPTGILTRVPQSVSPSTPQTSVPSSVPSNASSSVVPSSAPSARVPQSVSPSTPQTSVPSSVPSNASSSVDEKAPMTPEEHEREVLERYYPVRRTHQKKLKDMTLEELLAAEPEEEEIYPGRFCKICHFEKGKDHSVSSK
jgi:hypothetical protein